MTEDSVPKGLPGSVGQEATGPCPYWHAPCFRDSTKCRKWIEVKSKQTTSIVGVTKDVTEWKCQDDQIMVMTMQAATIVATMAMMMGVIPGGLSMPPGGGQG